MKLRRIPGQSGEDWIPVFKTEVRAGTWLWLAGYFRKPLI